jgi:hypothetical protein
MAIGGAAALMMVNNGNQANILANNPNEINL